MVLSRITLLVLLIVAALVGCYSKDSEDAQAEVSTQILLDQAASIDAEYCNISGVTIGSPYQDVLETFGVTDDDFEIDSVGGQSKTRVLKHEGLISVVVDDIVTVVASQTASHGIKGGPSPGDSREQVIRMFGETSEGNGEEVDMLAYWCDEFKPLGDRVGMSISITDGEVEAVSVINDAYQ